jgi:hypothetical protein
MKGVKTRVSLHFVKFGSTLKATLMEVPKTVFPLGIRDFLLGRSNQGE